ncbi:MAG: energy transducer TonB [Bacteroidota bacterium]
MKANLNLTTMTSLLNFLGIPGTVAAFTILFLGIIFLLRYVIYKQSQAVIIAPPEDNVLIKKYPGVDAGSYKSLIYRTGLIFSLGLVLAIFEFPDYEDATLVQLTGNVQEFEEMQEIPPTEHKPPPPPKIKSPEIVAVDDEIEIEEEIEIDLDMEADEETIVEEVEFTVEEEEEEEVVEEIFEVVEDPASPKGGYQTFYAYFAKNMKYPRKALEVGISGKVFVRFVIDKDGSITQTEVVRGIGFGCDEEALRVLGTAPKWNPGKQRGRPVKQRMIIPIVFKLSDI